MAYTLPTSSASTVASAPSGAGNTQGLVIALVGAFPKGPTFDPTNPSANLVYTMRDGLNTYGDDAAGYNDLAGYNGPMALRLVFENARQVQPVVLPIRTGVTQATATIATLSSVTALTALGGSGGNGTTIVSSQTGSGATTVQIITITPPASTGLPTETYNYAQGTGVVLTWGALAALVNPQSKLVNFTINTADTATLTPAIATLATLVGGADGANPTAAQINAGVDLLANVTYNQQPIQIIVPLLADGAATGVTLHALNDAIAMLANGQRPQVIGAVSTTFGKGSGAVAGITTLAATLIPTENNGDSGRCMLMANNYPARFDPQTSNERLYDPTAVSAATAGLIATLQPFSTPRGRKPLAGFTKMREGYATSDRQNLVAGGANVADASGRLADERTTANVPASAVTYTARAYNAVQTCEDIWMSDAASSLNNSEIETASGPEAGQQIDTQMEFLVQRYIRAKLMSAAVIDTYETTPGDPTAWTEFVSWDAILGVRGIGLKSAINVTALAPATITATF